MIALYFVNDVRALDNHAIQNLGLDELFLMEQAGHSVFNAINNFFKRSFSRVLIACGSGNNGGDGFVLARLLAAQGAQVTLLCPPEEKLTPSSNHYYQQLKSVQGISFIRADECLKRNEHLKSDLVIDALLGTGAAHPLRDETKQLIQNLNFSEAAKVAIDIPSGLNADTGYTVTSFLADLTVTLAAGKPGLFIEQGKEVSGEVVFGSIGIVGNPEPAAIPAAYLVEQNDILRLLKKRPVRLNKFSAGMVTVFAGSETYPGAASLCAGGVLSGPAGALHILLPEELFSYGNLNIPREFVPEFYSLDDSEAENRTLLLQEYGEQSDVLCIGPGLPKSDGISGMIEFVLTRFPNVFKVLDAGAFQLLENGNYKKYNLKRAILTPHAGEFARILGISKNQLTKDILKIGQWFVKKTGAVLLYKSHRSIVFAADKRPVIIPVGNPGLAKYGSGDVLAGMTASFLAARKRRRHAAIAGAYIHGATADVLAASLSEYSLHAELIAQYAGKTIMMIKQGKQCFDI